VIFLF